MNITGLMGHGYGETGILLLILCAIVMVNRYLAHRGKARKAKSQELRRTTVGRMAVPGWLFGMLVCAAALPTHHAEERYWFRHDQLLAIPADTPAMSSYEAQLVPLLRAETLERMAALETSGDM